MIFLSVSRRINIFVSVHVAEHSLGRIDRRSLPFIGFDNQPQAGPFSSVSKFHDYICSLSCRNLDEGWRAYNYFRPLMPDTRSIVFTHSDIHQANILISATGPPRILAIVDWEQSGWYPDYWEYCRACFISGPWEKWRDYWIPKFLEPQPDIYPVYCELLMSFGGF